MVLIPLIRADNISPHKFKKALERRNNDDSLIPREDAWRADLSTSKKATFFTQNNEPLSFENPNPKIIILPHGKRQDPGNEKRFVGGIDSWGLGLSDKGIEQAHLVGEQFRKNNFNPSFIGISDALRTRQTFEIISQYFDKLPIILYDLTKAKLSKLLQEHPELEDLGNRVRRGWIEKPGQAYLELLSKANIELGRGLTMTPLLLGESYQDVYKRTATYFNHLALPWLTQGHDVLLIGHQGTGYVVNHQLEAASGGGELGSIVADSANSGEALVYTFDRNSYDQSNLPDKKSNALNYLQKAT